MVALSFRDRFADLVASRVKRQTVRASQRCIVGQRVQLYTGMRTKNCRKLVEIDPICIDVDYCALRPDYITFGDASRHPKADEFARLDGFTDYADMLAWFEATYGSPYFVGYVHKWDWPDRAALTKPHGGEG